MRISEEENDEFLNARLKQTIILDLAQHTDPVPIMRAAGLVPPSDEGIEIAMTESRYRLARVAPLTADVARISEILSEMTMHFILNEDGEKPSDEVLEAVRLQNAQIIRMGALIIIAHLLEYDILHYSERLGL